MPPKGQTLDSTRVRTGLSERARKIRAGEESAFFQLLALAEKRKDVITLGRGEPDIPTPQHIVAAAKKALDDGHTTYTNPAGLAQLREAIAKKLARDNGLAYDPLSEIIVTTGAQEALAVVMQTILDPGDEVLLASPFYNAYEANIILAGGVPSLVPTHEADAFEMRPAAIESRITPKTKLLALISPNNPTAAVLTESTLREIAALAIKHDLVVLSDELYEKIVYDDFRPVSIATLPGMRDRTIVVNGFSKSYSMTGFRVGYLAAPADYCRAALEPRHALSICSPTASQYAALAALTGPQDHLAEMKSRYVRRRDMMRKTFDEIGVTYALPRGAFYFFANIKGSGLDSFDFCKRAVMEYGLLFFPGSMYGPDGEGYIRISFLASEAELQEALARFSSLYKNCQAAA